MYPLLGVSNKHFICIRSVSCHTRGFTYLFFVLPSPILIRVCRSVCVNVYVSHKDLSIYFLTVVVNGDLSHSLCGKIRDLKMVLVRIEKVKFFNNFVDQWMRDLLK